jgi:hypothetical protein
LKKDEKLLINDMKAKVLLKRKGNIQRVACKAAEEVCAVKGSGVEDTDSIKLKYFYPLKASIAWLNTCSFCK